MNPFLISEKFLGDLSATHQGRISISGYNHQAAYAVMRLASMLVQRPALDLKDWPKLIRYDWGEDLDEVCNEDRLIFSQCKRVQGISQPANLATVMISFAPKWLEFPPKDRDRVAFRLVCSEEKLRSGGPLAEIKANDYAAIKDSFVKVLATKPSPTADRTIWQKAADDFGHGRLFDDLWSRVEVVYIPAGVIKDHLASPLLPAERSGLLLLLEHDRIAPRDQRSALDRLRRVIHDNLVNFDPTNDNETDRLQHSPRLRNAIDVALALASSRSDSEHRPPFEIIDRTFLTIQKQKTRRPFVARQPEWADVVHGTDKEVKFVERDITPDLIKAVVESLVEPIERGSDRRLHMLFVTGAPGSGKTTLTRRVAAMLVEAGRIVVADAGLDIREPVDRAEAYESELQSLAAVGKPVIFLLDDPLFGNSSWIPLLHRLARPGLNLAVLAPTPKLLYERHADRIVFGVRHIHQLGPPTDHERGEMAAMYGRDTRNLQSADEFLVIAIEAAAGVRFDEIIIRLWRTLNDGQPILDDEENGPENLRWTVRAFLVVSFFHRAYAACPESLLQAALDLSGGNPEGTTKALTRLHDQHGWNIFHVGEPALQHLGGSVLISTAHQRIAHRAWELRPMRWYDVGNLIIEASFRSPQAVRHIGQLATRLASGPDEFDKKFVRSFVRAWSDQSRLERVDTRYLCDLGSALQFNGQRELAKELSPEFQRRTKPSSDGWLAALQLCYRSGESERKQSFPDGIDLVALIRAADFSIAPHRALRFQARLPKNIRSEFKQRLVASFDGKLPWTLESFLMAHLIKTFSREEIASRMESLRAWLDQHPRETVVRTAFVSMLRSPGLNIEDELKVVADVEAWLRFNPHDAAVRTVYVAVARKVLPAERSKQVVVDTERWSQEHPNDHTVRMAFDALAKASGNAAKGEIRRQRKLQRKYEFGLRRVMKERLSQQKAG